MDDITECERFARLRDGRDASLRQADLCRQMAAAAEAAGDKRLARELRHEARDWEESAETYERSM